MPLGVGRRSASQTSLGMGRDQQRNDQIQPLIGGWVFLVDLMMKMTWWMTCRKRKIDGCRNASGFLRKTAERTRAGDLPFHPRRRWQRRNKPKGKERLHGKCST